MTPGHQQIAGGEAQGLRDQLAEFPVPQDEHPVAGVQGNLLLDLERGGERLGEGGRVGRDVVRNGVQVFDRKREIVGKRPVPPHDTQHGPALAVGATPGPARAAAAAHRVDLPHHAAAP